MQIFFEAWLSAWTACRYEYFLIALDLSEDRAMFLAQQCRDTFMDAYEQGEMGIDTDFWLDTDHILWTVTSVFADQNLEGE